MALQAKDITAILKRQIEEFEAPLEAVDIGSVIEVGDGIARVSGLTGAMTSLQPRCGPGNLLSSSLAAFSVSSTDTLQIPFPSKAYDSILNSCISPLFKIISSSLLMLEVQHIFQHLVLSIC